VKRSARDEPMWVAIYICVEIMLGISLYSYFYLKLGKKTHYVFFIISYVSSSTKSKNKRTEQVLSRSGEWGGGR
jgi:hypothetical protein